MALASAQILCMVLGAALVLSMRQELALAEARLGADLLIYPTQAMSKISKTGLLMQGTPVQVYKSRSMLSRLADCDDIDVVSYQIYLSAENSEGQTIRITGYEPESDFVISPWIREGMDFIPPEGTLIVGSNVPLSDDKSVMLFQKDWSVSGHLLETGSELDAMVFVSPETLNRLIDASAEAGIQTYSKIDPQTMWSAALVRVNDKENVESVTNWVNIYVRKVTAIRSEETLTATAADIQRQVKMISAITAAVWLVLLIALWIIQSMLMRERKKEFYVWYVVGASSEKIDQMILREAFRTHLAGALAGLFLSGILILIFRNRFTLSGCRGSLLFAAAFSVLLALLTGCLSAWLSGKSTVKSINGQMLVSI